MAHTVYSNMTIGGDLTQTSQEPSKVVNGGVIVGGSYPDRGWNFNSGVSKAPFSSVFDWSAFEGLAQHLVPGTYGSEPYHIFVLTSGGTFSIEDFPGVDQGENNGRTLAVFNTDEDVVLTRSSLGRAFGPTVLAPFSKVTLANDAGYIDGLLVAKEAVVPGTSLQMHGDVYKGPLECDCVLV